MRWFALGLSIFFLAALSAPSTTHAFTSNCTGGTIDTATQPGTTTHTFTSTGTTTLDCTGTGGGLAYVLIVAAGGGGGGAGGGGGGVIASSSFMLPASSITVAVGGGGGGGVNGATDATMGTSSSVCSNCSYTNSFVYANGGGAWRGAGTGVGGSGSGAGWGSTGAAGTAGQGNAGGNGDTGSPFNPGGGGGCNSVGSNAAGAGNAGGAGGTGCLNTITGSTTATYGAGGGGGSDNTVPASVGGAGGSSCGGKGANASPATDGVDGLRNRGCGGGGFTNGGHHGGNGGDGIVVVAYATPATGTPTNNDGSQWFMLLFAVPIVPAIRRRYTIAAIFLAALLALFFSFQTIHKQATVRAGGIGKTVSALTGTGRTPYYAHVVNGVVVNKLIDPSGMIPRGDLGPPSEWILTDADVGDADFTYDKTSNTFTDLRPVFVPAAFVSSTSSPSI